MSSMVRRAWVTIVAAGLAGPCVAQVAPPPPPAEPEAPAYEPPPRPERRPAQAATQRINPNNATATRQRRQVSLPAMTYVPMSQRDASGKMIPVTGVLDVVALTHNPTVGQTGAEAIVPVYAARLGRIEQRVINNMDLLRRIDTGDLAALDIKDISGLTRVTEMIKPLIEPVSLTQELETAGVLTEIQAEFNRKIMREYQIEANREFKLEGADGMTAFVRQILSDSLREARVAQDGLIAESLPNAGKVLDGMGLGSDARVAPLLALSRTGLSEDAAERAAQLETARRALETLSVEEHAAYLSAARGLRADPAMPAVDFPNLDQFGKVSMSRSNVKMELTTQAGTFRPNPETGKVERVENPMPLPTQDGRRVDPAELTKQPRESKAGASEEKDGEKNETP
jgi:hypothetical protein